MGDKKYLLSLCLGFCVFALTGCVGTRDLTEEQLNIIAEYSAGVVLQHEEGYAERLVKQEIPETSQPTAVPQMTSAPEETLAPAEEAGVETESQAEALTETSLNDIYGIAGMSVTCDSYTVCREYAGEFRAKDKTDYLLVVHYKVKNTTSKPLKVNLMKRKLEYTLDMDGSAYEAQISFLQNGGMNFLKTTIKPDSVEEAVVLYEIPETQRNPKSVTVTVKDGSRVSTTKLK